MQGVQPLLRRYWTWRAISWSERGGRKEKVSKNLEKRAGVKIEEVSVGRGAGEGRGPGRFRIARISAFRGSGKPHAARRGSKKEATRSAIAASPRRNSDR
jgi:hypothetical protein